VALAIFDLDNTLLAGDSDHAWGQFLVDEGIVDTGQFKRANDRFYQDYLDGSLDIQKYLEFSLEPLTRHSMEELVILRHRFVETRIKPIMLPAAIALLAQHRNRGDYLMIITATNRFVTEPIARLFGVDHLIATDPELLNNRYTGRISGVPSFQAGKVTRLNHWLEHSSESLEGAFFYSDSHNDLPLLELVDTPVAVDPDKTLEAFAKERGWKILSLRTG
jgi:HAD superfamily hydrolase (TIGR01490 family)